MNRQDLRQQGEAMLRTLFGTTAQPAGLANLLTEAAYGGIWTRPGLSIPDRLICSIAALGVGPRLKALRRHISAGSGSWPDRRGDPGNPGTGVAVFRFLGRRGNPGTGRRGVRRPAASSSRPTRRKTLRWKNSTSAVQL